ncbi:flagellar M-ring protein FliF [Limimonas halophila]|uniref:Flagellar M-ring protein n=1 Tax=Limimonas halophila TaxID=1082479 RepID=A0A1G7M6E5_9PROT|nr:flagellar basal-body MS-ring/collar protein FliF [Limimonas halophila]SDF56770.1 flagellar M-ring protein FliF [Limimonas halophila]
MNTFLDTLKSLGATRLAIMGAVAAGILAFFIYLTSQLASQNYGLLFAGLNNDERSQIVSELEKRGVDYQVTGGGKRIEVPTGKVDQLRVAMAEKGLPSSGSVGYEIFDESGGLGTTNFVQNVNRVRAIQGELEQTIRAMNNVQQARVHVVMPQRELFNQERKKSSASIVLRMSGNSRLDDSQVQSVQHLVASAVPNLEPNMVSIVDQQGTLLARGDGEEGLAGMAMNAQEIRAERERRIARAVEQLIGRHVGPGNVRAEVSADMNFSQVTERTEDYDPAEQVARSEQTTETQESERDTRNQEGVTVGNQLPENQDGGGGEGNVLQQSNQSSEEETINYEISNTQTTRVKQGPRLERLSVAVLVDGKYVTNDNGEQVYEQRSQEELQKIASLARSAVGFSQERGDQLEVINMKFNNPAQQLEPADDGGLLGLPEGQLMRAAELLVLGVVAVLILLLVVRPLVSRLLESAATQPAPQPAGAGYGGDQMLPEGGAAAGQLPAGGGAVAEFGADEEEEEAEQLVDLNKVEGRVRASSMRKISEIVERHPEEAVTILRNWLYQQ